MEDLLGSGQAFERWIKMGSVTPSSAAEAVELPVNRKPQMLLHLQMTASADDCMSHNNVPGFPLPPLPLLDLRCKSCVLYRSIGDCSHSLHYWARIAVCNVHSRSAHACDAKHGFKAISRIAAAVGTTSALHDELRAVARRRSRTAAEADEEEDEAGAAETEDPEAEHTGELCYQVDLEVLGMLKGKHIQLCACHTTPTSGSA